MNKKIAKITDVNTKKGVFNKVNLFFNKHRKQVCFIAALCLVCVLANENIAYASTPPAGGGTADTLWQTISGLMKTWVTRLGGVVMFVGGVLFGLGWKTDDAEGKSRGISTLIAGAIVIAVAQLVGTFFK